jgi:hypothetical protein
LVAVVGGWELGATLQAPEAEELNPEEHLMIVWANAGLRQPNAIAAMNRDLFISTPIHMDQQSNGSTRSRANSSALSNLWRR